MKPGPTNGMSVNTFVRWATKTRTHREPEANRLLAGQLGQE